MLDFIASEAISQNIFYEIASLAMVRIVFLK